MATNDTSTCPLCRHENVQIFAIGDCLHPVCYVCAVKMRILCEETYCAICRQELAQIYLVANRSLTREKIDPTIYTPIDDTGACGIFYPTKADGIRRKAEKLLRNFCPICHVEFESFEVLRQHARMNHRVFYCDLCVEHLNLFPHERKYYTRADLVQHLRNGDKDDKSMRGHPLCKFCNDHFLDNDQLYKHMRQEHYYCHLCSSDNVYYSTFELLRNHYRSAHFLCEIDQCRDVQFTNVFPNEFEFRAHQAAQHSKNRATARQLGKVQVEFQSTSARDRRQQRETTNNADAQNQNDRDETNRDGNAAAAVPSIDEFPTLSQRVASASATTTTTTTQGLPQQRGAWANDLRGNYSNEDFPALTKVASNSSNQPRGAWGENQSQITTISSSTTRKNLIDSSATIKEDFPALQSAANPRIPSSVSLVSAWSNANKSAKTAKANKKTQPQMRMNSNRILNDNDEEDECIRRPMSTLMISTTPQVSSNITMISSTDVNAATTTSRNQSLPKSHDFPALPTTVRTPPVNPVPSGAWANNATPSAQPTTNQQKKKSGLSSKKKFLEEIRALSPPQPPTVTTDSPMVGLSELGRRLITEETPEVKKEEKPSTSPSAPSTENQAEKKTKTTPSKKKKSPQVMTTNSENVVEEKSERSKNVVRSEPESTRTSSSEPVQSVPIVETSLVTSSPPPPAPPPPGFSTSVGSVQPPPGFNMLSSSPPSYIVSSSYDKDKENFREKLLQLFDGDLNLFVEYDKFCQAFAGKSINSNDFLKFTRELFHEKFNEYLLDLIVLIPNIDQQNELYDIWKSENPTTNWTKKNGTSVNQQISQCHHCRQLMFENDMDEHKSHHSDFNAEFPSLPSASVSIGRGRGKKNK